MSALSINFVGLWIPAKVLMCPDIRGHEILLFAQIYALQGNPRGCYASNEYFSQFLGLAKSTVSEYIKALYDKGLIDVLRGRDENGVEERQMFISAVGRDLFAPDSPIDDGGASAERRGGFGIAKGGLRPSEGENKDINISLPGAGAREDLAEFWQRVKTAAGEALADPAKCPGTSTPRELLYLLNDLPNSPACTADEVIDAVEAAAKWWMGKAGPGSMVNFDLARKKAWQFRDARLHGAPVREAPKPKGGEGLGDPATWDLAKWRGVIRLGLHKGEWDPAWGPPPGAEGSKVPGELVGLWKGE